MMNHAKMNSHVVTACIAAVVAFGASWATGQSAPVVPDVVMAHDFWLLDKEGRMRGRWHIGHNDEVRFTLYDPKKNARVGLVAAPRGQTFLTLKSDNAAQKQTSTFMQVSRDSSTFGMASHGNEPGFAVAVSPAFSQMGIGETEGTSVILPKSSINLSASHGHSVICLGQKSGDDSAADCWSFDGSAVRSLPGGKGKR